MNSSNFYHVFNRAVDRQPVFLDSDYYTHFTSLIARYISQTNQVNKYGYVYPNYHQDIRIHAYCLMPNHFHMCIEELTPGALGRFMQSLKGAYCRYFNLRNDRTGVLFETKYHAEPLPTDNDFINAIRYIHMNPLVLTPDYANYRYSSLRYYMGMTPPVWLETKLFRSFFPNAGALLQFHEDYKRQLAIDALTLIQV